MAADIEKPATRTTVVTPSTPAQTDRNALRWGVVSTIKAPAMNVARFIAWHLDMGAAEIVIHLDEPDTKLAERLAHPKVRYVQCDDVHWAQAPEKARKTHQLRQAYNATHTYNRSKMDWLCHIDVDEFLLTEEPLAHHLITVPNDAAFARITPVEMLASDDPWNKPAYFKRARKHAKRTKHEMRLIYPTFGNFLPDGFISYTGGKNIARVGLPNVRIGIHAMLQKGAKIINGHALPDVVIGHAHAPSWDAFERHFDHRISKGSYRKKVNETMVLNDVLNVVTEEDGDVGLRAFFDEMCFASPERLDLLAAHDMLVTWTLDLDEKVARHFGSSGI
ncbi:MAG: glycosyltransferase family 2 protein [Ascidiaceihabitans sp.]|nr:glycosyltransferase family 2 protein [Ascidiaceihabitans sp.]